MTKIIIALISFFVMGCTTLYSVAPVAIVEPPQNSSIDDSATKNNRVHFGTLPAQGFKIADNVASRPLELVSSPKLINVRELDFGYRMPMNSKLEIGISGFPILSERLSGQLTGMVKYQFLGEAMNSPAPSEVDFSLFSHLVIAEVNLVGNQQSLFSEGGYPWEAYSRFQGISAGVSIGKSLTRNLYLYSGIAQQSFQISAGVHQFQSATGDYPEVSYQLPRSQGQSRNYVIGLSFGVKRQLNLVLNNSQTNWNDLVLNTYNLNLMFLFYDFGKTPQLVKPDSKL